MRETLGTQERGLVIRNASKLNVGPPLLESVLHIDVRVGDTVAQSEIKGGATAEGVLELHHLGLLLLKEGHGLLLSLSGLRFDVEELLVLLSDEVHGLLQAGAFGSVFPVGTRADAGFGFGGEVGVGGLHCFVVARLRSLRLGLVSLQGLITQREQLTDKQNVQRRV